MNNDSHRILSELVRAQENGEIVVLATVTKAHGSVPRHPGSKMLVYEDGRTSGSIGGGEMESRVLQEAEKALQDGKPRILPYKLVDPGKGDPGLCGGEVEIYLEPQMQLATLYIIGCGHIGRALAAQARLMGYQVAVTDDRTELVTPEYIPDADHYLPGKFEDALATHPVTTNTFVAVVTRNVMVDRQILPQLVTTPAPYIGVMGSKRRWAETKRMLMADGLSEADLERFHSPLGLELNAETPEEIAVSIMAEIIMLHRGGTGERMHD
jgi:xanthine dehydrogenase accessory factor